MPRFASTVPVLRVTDVARSIAWYQGILGFAATTVPDDAPYTSAVLMRDNAELVLRSGRTAAVHAGSVDDWDVYLRLDGGELIALLDDARSRTPLVRGPERMPSGWVEFELEDPDGHRICIAEPLTDTHGIPDAVR